MPVLTKCFECGNDIVRKVITKTGRSYCDIVCKANWQKRAKPVTKEWLIQKYVVEKLDCVQIGKIVSRDPKSVWNWLKDFGIPRRKQGHASSATWLKKGCPNPWIGRKHTEETKRKMSERSKAEGRVPYDPAVGSYMKGRRGADVHNWKGGVTPQRQALYSSKEWKSVVRKVWRRDNAECQRCAIHRGNDAGISFDIHHIVSFAIVELRAEFDNLVLLCKPCHRWVHSSLNVDKDFIKEMSVDV